MQQSNDNNKYLLLEYERAMNGYEYRDKVIPQEFSYMFQVFSVLLALIGASNTLLLYDEIFLIIVDVIIGIIGVVALFSFLVDIESNTSCKQTLRKCASELEDKYKELQCTYWETIAQRNNRFFEERLTKYVVGKSGEYGSAATGFVQAGRLLIIFWFILVVIFILHVMGRI